MLSDSATVGDDPQEEGGFSPNLILTAIQDRRRRAILALLSDRTAPLDERELATNLAATEQEKTLLDVTEREVRQILTDLALTQLPKLESVGLVERDQEAGTVTTTDHPALQDPTLTRIIETQTDNLDEILHHLAFTRRRIALAVLHNRDDPMSRSALARAILVYERSEEAEIESSSIEDLCAALHHIHLPLLDEVDLIEYDIASGTASYEGHPMVEEAGWLSFTPDDTPSAILPTATQPTDIWTLEGRANVISRGQALFDWADEELFLMFTTDGLLEEECIAGLQEAVRRGVDVYLGSQTQGVRDLVRKRIPGATIWEPQLDWLNLPPTYEKVGRLVMADRTAIMLATLGEEGPDGIHCETALTGQGKDNPLVILLREMLGSRLDHLDAQSEDFLSEIPL